MIGKSQPWLTEREYLPQWMRGLVSLAVQCLVAVAGALIIGSLPEVVLSRAYYNTYLDPYSPAIALIAFLLGYFVSPRVRKGQAATFVWVVGFLWLIYGMYDTVGYWGASWSPEKTRWSYMLANLFGPTYKCSGSECLGELLFTTPFAASVTYSIAAYIRRRRSSVSPNSKR